MLKLIHWAGRLRHKKLNRLALIELLGYFVGAYLPIYHLIYTIANIIIIGNKKASPVRVRLGWNYQIGLVMPSLKINSEGMNGWHISAGSITASFLPCCEAKNKPIAPASVPE